jgi:hypothetical protein
MFLRLFLRLRTLLLVEDWGHRSVLLAKGVFPEWNRLSSLHPVAAVVVGELYLSQSLTHSSLRVPMYSEYYEYLYLCYLVIIELEGRLPIAT